MTEKINELTAHLAAARAACAEIRHSEPGASAYYAGVAKLYQAFSALDAEGVFSQIDQVTGRDEELRQGVTAVYHGPRTRVPENPQHDWV